MKPRVMILVIFTAFVGMVLAPVTVLSLLNFFLYFTFNNSWVQDHQPHLICGLMRDIDQEVWKGQKKDQYRNGNHFSK